MGQRASNCARPPPEEREPSTAPPPVHVSASKAQGEVQQAFANQADWEAVFASLRQNTVVAQHYGEWLDQMSPAERKILEVRTLVPLAVAAYASKPGVLSAKRKAVLNGYRDFAEKKGIAWRADAANLEARGLDVWEAERASVRRHVEMPWYYKTCYEGPIHSYDKGNGEWIAAFDAPSAYLLVHMHHYPALSPQAAFDKLHEEFDTLTLSRLSTPSGCPVRVVDVGCGVGTSTFSTARCLERAGRSGKVTGVDLSDYFITVAQRLQQLHKAEFKSMELEFLHGNGLDLACCGFEDGSLEMVVVSEVTHEMPKLISEALFAEAYRVLVPGGVLGYLDLNSAQILKENLVGSLVDRVATCNEPYFDEYLELNAAVAMRAAGFEVLEETWPNHAKYSSLESCSLRIIVAKKPPAVTMDTWTGHWAIDRRENWEPYLKYLGVPEVAYAAATRAPDFHEYSVSEASFFMDHRIPGQKMHLRYTGFLDDEWQASPYPKPTASMFDKRSTVQEQEHCFKHRWVERPTCFETTLPGFGGPDNTVVLRRELVSPDEIKCTVHALETASGTVLVGPCYSFLRRTSAQPPQSVGAELKERFAEGHSLKLEWRLDALDRAAAVILENEDALSAAQAADHVSPSSMRGASLMVKNALAFYKAGVPSWAAAQRPSESLPASLQTEGEWEIVPQPKGVGLVIAPWNAPALLSILPLMGMLAAGNLCVIKPSEGAPTVSRLLARLVSKYFPDRSVVVAEGGKETVEALISTPVEHILFTGGGEVGKKILALAARHLTPVSLELGGKNPCFVDVAERGQLELYAAEIVGTKKYFSGQFCQAQDYCLVCERSFDEFVEILAAKIEALGEQRSCQMISAAQARRVRALLEGHEGIACPPLPQADAAQEDCVPLTVLIEPPVDAVVMRDEIFGPLLPVLKVASIDEAVALVRQRPKPLVAYCYSSDPMAWAAFRDATSSGNLGINCGPQRMQGNMNVGFGGTGESGCGYSIWGRAAFDDFSHHKTVFCGKKFAGSVWGAASPPKAFP